MLANILYGFIGFVVLLNIIKLLARSKARFTLETDQKRYHEGDTIALNVKLKSKKELQSERIFVEIRCVSKSKGKNQTRKTCYHSEVFELEKPSTIAANSERAWSISIPIPRDILQKNKEKAIEQTAQISSDHAEALSKMLDNKLVKGFGELQYHFGTEWYLRAVCECKGLDIQEKLEIRVS